MRRSLEREGAEIWEEQLETVADHELMEVREQLALAIRRKSGGKNLQVGSTRTMGLLRETMQAASSGRRIDEAKLRAVVEGISDPQDRKLVQVSGDLILKLQDELPDFPREYVDVHLAFEANRIILESGQGLN